MKYVVVHNWYVFPENVFYKRWHKPQIIGNTYLKDMLLDLLYPVCCVGCGRPGVSICERCEARLTYVEKDVCIYCKKDSLFGLTHQYCKKIEGITGAMSIFHYNPFLKRIIAAIKYDLATTVWRDFSLVIRPTGLYKLSFFKSLKKDICLVSMPLHPKRRRLRGFNQADLIATWIQGYLDIPVCFALERKKDTAYQARLHKTADRGKNVKNAFTATENMTGKTIIIVDDVLTSGATVKEAARACFNSGAEAVYALTIAHG